MYRRTLSNKMEYRRAVNVYQHPLYDSAKFLGDLALIKVSDAVDEVTRAFGT